MEDEKPRDSQFPLLKQLLVHAGMEAKGMYRVRDLAELMGVRARTIQEWIRAKKIKTVRHLPGRNAFLPQDIEEFLQESQREPEKHDE